MISVSIIIPTYNRSDLIERAIRSVLNQTVTNLECIVVDDCSSDDTVSVVESIDDDRISLIQLEENRGASAARNRGIEAASGDIIAFLDDDDEWHPKKLEKQVDLLQSVDDSVGLVYCWMNYRRSDGTLVTEYQPKLRGEIFPDVLDKQRITNSSTLMTYPSVIEEIGGFDESLPRGNDGDFIRRVALKFNVDYVPQSLVTAFVNHGNERITSEDPDALRKAIASQEAKLRKFHDELERRPEKRAIIYSKIARRCIQLGAYSSASLFFCKAFGLSPLVPETYKQLYRGFRYKIRVASLS